MFESCCKFAKIWTSCVNFIRKQIDNNCAITNLEKKMAYVFMCPHLMWLKLNYLFNDTHRTSLL